MMINGTKVVVVGGSSGIGRAVALAALERGAEVTIVGRSAENLEAAARATAGRAKTLSADATREEDVTRMFDAVGAFDHLVVTAVVGAYAPIAKMDGSAAHALIDSKLLAAILLAKHAQARLRPRGSVTFTSGIAKDRPMAGGSVVAAVNGALGAFARALALELAPARVNVVSPGWVDTPVWDRIAGAGKADVLEAMARRLPVGRVGTAEDLAHAYVFLMENEFTTGTTLHVDGGHALI
jgi:NAD(P)-dependent dehydrogenase (short-subunit alcohol dehydrogenase family)